MGAPRPGIAFCSRFLTTALACFRARRVEIACSDDSSLRARCDASAIANPKGGAGEDHLALSLRGAMRGHKTLLIDLAPSQ